MIRNHLIAGVTALALGTSGLTATPARADHDTARIVTGLAALAIIGTAISKSRKHDHHGLSRSRGYSPYYYRSYNYGHRRHYSSGYHRYKYKHHYRHRYGGHRHKRYYYRK